MDNCKQIQKMIKDYDKGNLSLKQEEQFIQHILNCEDCKEELEIYYIVSYGLDEDNISKNTPPAIKACIDSYDFKTLVVFGAFRTICFQIPDHFEMKFLIQDIPDRKSVV